VLPRPSSLGYWKEVVLHQVGREGWREGGGEGGWAGEGEGGRTKAVGRDRL
jgi:hypothetical protein